MLKEFGRREFSNLAYVSCDRNDSLQAIFAGDFDVVRIVRGLSALTGVDIIPGKNYYSSDTSRMEMDFLIQKEGALLPMEEKGETSVKANSLHHFFDATSGDIRRSVLDASLQAAREYHKHAFVFRVLIGAIPSHLF